MKMKFAAIAVLLAVVATAVTAMTPKPGLELPKDYRGTMYHLGSWFSAEGDASGFHDVYANKIALEGYRRTGKFPDGSVLVKEVREATSGDYTTGFGINYATDKIKTIFLMVKDSKHKSDDPLWQEGWGWAQYNSPEGESITTSFEADCMGCHLPAEETDWVYTEAYPSLKK